MALLAIKDLWNLNKDEDVVLLFSSSSLCSLIWVLVSCINIFQNSLSNTFCCYTSTFSTFRFTVKPPNFWSNFATFSNIFNSLIVKSVWILEYYSILGSNLICTLVLCIILPSVPSGNCCFLDALSFAFPSHCFVIQSSSVCACIWDFHFNGQTGPTT
jgi:hypothetical protein